MTLPRRKGGTGVTHKLKNKLGCGRPEATSSPVGK